MRPILLGLAVFVIGICGAYSQNGNGNTKSNEWNQWRGPNRNGVAPDENLLKQWPESVPQIVWKKAIGDGYSGISVADEKLYTIFFHYPVIPDKRT